jgi:hypothetical protein
MSMRQLRIIFLILAFILGGAVTSYSQKTPPPPTDKRHKGPPCNPGNGNGGGPGVPPPPGLCLPIDDYVYLLMAVGIMYGCYKVRKIEFS